MVLTRALTRQYASLVKLGYFDPPSSTPYRSLGWADVATPQAEQLAYQAAVEGITLLKNDGVLPLSVRPGMSIALIGDWANATTQMQGNYYGVAPYLISPLVAAEKLGVKVNYGYGPSQGNPTTIGWNDSLAAAQNSDIVIYAGGIDNSVESEGMDRSLISWSGGQIDLITKVCSVGKKCILLQMGGGQLDDTPFKNNPNISAILWGGYPGQSGGQALIDIVTGKATPAGRLPITQYPANYVNEVPMTNMNLRPGPGNPGRTYKWYGSAVYEFGYGMHYTTFSTSFHKAQSKTTYEISTLTKGCSEKYPDKCAFDTFPVTVQNTGKMTSDFVTLGFISGQYGPAPYPRKQLVAYQRLHSIAPATSQTAQLKLTLGSLARIDDKGNSVLYPGDYALLIDVPTQSYFNFTLTGGQVMLDKWPQPPARAAQ